MGLLDEWQETPYITHFVQDFQILSLLKQGQERKLSYFLFFASLIKFSNLHVDGRH